MKQEFLVQVPTAQYEFVQVKAESLQQAKELRDSILEAWKEHTPTKGIELRDLQKLLYKRLCNQGLEIEEVNKLGTDKVYSQQDIHKIVESLVAKSKREAGGSRADSINRIIQRD